MKFQLISIAVLIVFYGCYFLKMMLQKKKGIQTDQMGKGKIGFVRTIELLMKVASISVPIIELISIYLNKPSFPVWLRNTGIVVSLLGDVIFVISVLTMRDSWRAGVSETDKTELVTSGIYKFSRNPAFLGFDLVYIGILLMFFNWILFILSIFAIVMFHLQIINVEESFLAAAFGEEYLEYKKKVNRYWGRK
ncbi:MAG: isoprenylcysteine carboxylmethyltransferase family protein [Lachnospiraceae bacterium]|nr:isoprenylcysteine carboxylmethyltransferase family protein [Lachnospiraceae bacterium]